MVDEPFDLPDFKTIADYVWQRVGCAAPTSLPYSKLARFTL